MAAMGIFCLCMAANPISPKKVLSKARLIAGTQLSIEPSDIRIAYKTVRTSGEPSLYVVNMGHGKGFVVLSGDDSTEELIGYNDQGDFDASQMPDNMRAWLDMWTAQLDEELSTPTTAVQRASRVKAINNHSTAVIEPLITSRWGQASPYNKLCPTLGDVKCPTGCVATALSQILRYHHYPNGNTTSIPSYVTTTNKLNMPELPPTSFNWELMTDEVNEESPQETIDEVAKLMKYCGQTVKMDYRDNGAGSFFYDLPEGLPNYFGYPNTLHHEYRESYDEEGWEQLLVNELQHHQPVLYSAYTNTDAGHAFICDGYDGNGFFHINWGWAGAADGYYRLPSAHAKGEGLNPNVKNYHLSMNQSALIGIKAEGTDDFTAPAEELWVYSRPSLKNGRIYTRANATSPFTGITLILSVANTLSTQKAFFHGYGLYDDNNTLVTTLKPTSNTSTFAANGKKDLELSSVSLSGIENGHYTLKAIYKDKNSAPWQPMGGTDKNYTDVVISDTEMTLTPVPKADFAVNAIWMDKSFLNIDFDNNDEVFFGTIYLRKYNTKTKVVTEICHDNLSADPQSHSHYELFIPEDQSLNLSKDKYYLSVDYYDTQYFYTNEKVAKDNLHKQVVIENLSEDGQAIVGDRVMGHFTVRNDGSTGYNGVVKLTLGDDLDNITRIWSDTLDIASGDSIVIPFEYLMSDTLRQYCLRTIHQTGTYSWSCDSTGMLRLTKGAIYWTRTGELKVKTAAPKFQVPEEALAIILGNAYVSNVTPNSNPNTIYILNNKLPTGLKSTNYVRSSYEGDDLIFEGSNLKFTDGYDYLIPRKMIFTGDVTYTRNLTDSTSLAWSTLSLPFKPTSIMADDEGLMLRQDDENEENHLRILEITRVKDTIVTTSYATALEAHTPYLMAYDTLLVGKTLRFEAQDCTIAPTLSQDYRTTAGNYTLQGTHVRDSILNCYTLDGNRLRHAEKGYYVDAFRAYLTCDSTEIPTLLAIDIDNPEPELPRLAGDANMDQRVNVADVMLVVRFVLKEDIENFSYRNADFDEDGEVNITDAVSIVKAVLGDEEGEEGEEGSEGGNEEEDNEGTEGEGGTQEGEENQENP